eukprot:6174047-Pleurochrysis_carterae.AAC.1
MSRQHVSDTLAASPFASLLTSLLPCVRQFYSQAGRDVGNKDSSTSCKKDTKEAISSRLHPAQRTRARPLVVAEWKQAGPSKKSSMSGSTFRAEDFAEAAGRFEAVGRSASWSAGWEEALRVSTASRDCIRGTKSSSESELAYSLARLNPVLVRAV